MFAHTSRALGLSLYIAIVELALLAGATSHLSAQSNATIPPAPPQIFLDTTPVAAQGSTFVVAAGGDFQAALNAAQPGDQILLQAGATYTGPFTLPVKSGSTWIVVRTSAPDSSLPPYGSRITPAWSSLLPKIVTTGTQAALLTAPGAHHFRFVGVEFAVASGVALNYGIVTMGDGSSAQNTLSMVPFALVFDRVYVHGNGTGNIMRGIALNSASTAIVNSYVADIHAVGYDTQAIAGWNGPGPFKIANNYLEAAAENVLFGGADPSIPNLVPSDIEVRGNYLFKPLEWRQGSPTYAGMPWTIKNLFELKNAQRVLVDGNVMEHNWPQSQNGYSVLFTVRNQGGTAPWSIVADVAFTHNIVRHVANAMNVLAFDDTYPSQQTARVLVQDNLFDDVSAAAWGGNGRLLQLLGGAANLTVDHNTSFQSGDFVTASGPPQIGFTFTNNIVPNNTYGLGGDNCYGQPLLCISKYLPGSLIAGNVIAGGAPRSYPAGNFFPATLADVGFTSLAGGNYQLASSSPYRNAATDARDPGADWNALVAATGGTVSGADVTPPVISIAQPASGASVAGTTVVSASAFDSQSVVAQVVFFVDGSPIASLSAPPFQASWDTTAVVNGPHVVSAMATDGAGNQAIASGVTVTVSNLVISGVNASNIGDVAATITWNTNLAADSQVQYGTTASYGSTSAWNATLVTSHAQALGGLTASTTYHYRVLSRDASGNLIVSPDFVFTTSASVTIASGPVPVVWTALVNVTASGGSLKKTSGCNGCQDAGAASALSIPSGDGYVEFTMSEVASERAIGLNIGNPGTSINEIAFCLLIWPGGGVNVRESGVYRMGFTGSVGDALRVSVTRGIVTYARNGIVFYTSKVAPAYPLIADTSILTAAGTITNAVISGAR